MPAFLTFPEPDLAQSGLLPNPDSAQSWLGCIFSRKKIKKHVKLRLGITQLWAAHS